MRAIDLREHAPDQGRWISAPLAEAVSARLAAGEQALLFLNRRGYAPLTICRACGHQVGCDQCDARMVEHRFRHRLVCHQCGATKPIPTACPSCKVEGKMATLGPGVERLAEEAAALWPDARLAILSSDLADGPGALKARIEEIASGGADLVIGTQLVSKGHNFPLLTLVGVIDADLGLQGGDLRAAEKTFQLIRQVAGRAGRAERPGLALVQTHQPDHPALEAILSGDDEAFWRAEADARRRALMPPYGRLAGILVTGTDEAKTWEVARVLARAADPLRAAGIELWGPAPAPIARIRGRHRVRLLARAPKGVAMQAALRGWVASVPAPVDGAGDGGHRPAELLLSHAPGAWRTPPGAVFRGGGRAPKLMARIRSGAENLGGVRKCGDLMIMLSEVAFFLRSAWSASRACAALESGQTPSAHDLRRLGISGPISCFR